MLANVRFFKSLRRGRLDVRRDLDPRSPYWLLLGGLFGFALWNAASPQKALGHTLLHERGIIQPISMVVGGMVIGFICTKLAILINEIRLERKTRLPDFPCTTLQDDAYTDILKSLEMQPSILGRRFTSLVTVWSKTASSTKVEATLDNETEAYDLSLRSSYAFPRILIWSIPILGFIGTVVGIGESVSGFQSFLSKADDIDVLRDGLINVTSGLGTAFDTTFLALLISIIVVLPMSLTERLEQRLLTKIDLTLRKIVLEDLPDQLGGNIVDSDQIETSIDKALKKHLPSPEALVEPAKVFAMRAAALVSSELAPLRSMGEEAVGCMQDARASTKAQAQEITEQMNSISDRISSSIDSLKPVLDAIYNLTSTSEDLRQELEKLRDGDKLSSTFKELQSTLIDVRNVLIISQKPKKVVLVEQVTEE